MTKILSAFLFIGLFLIEINGINVENLEEIGSKIDTLPNGNEKSGFLKLDTPIHLYSNIYDHIYINTNGILTFDSEFATYLNIQFPLEYAAIAPFYSNVDTSQSDETSSITYYETSQPEYITSASNEVKLAYDDASHFNAKSVLVVSWENVGHYDGKNNVTNTFSVRIISNDEESYVHFVYPTNGLNWIQADVGESGLPDVRAQAGFISEDGRFFNLKGSGTDNVKYLTDLSNYHNPGNWMFRVGPLGYEDNVEEPQIDSEEEIVENTCQNNGKYKCHSHSDCLDTRSGFCCSCKPGFYGNGYNCVHDDIPIRVAGTIKGAIGNEQIDSQLQSYVVMADGKSYTAINPIPRRIGDQIQLLQVLGETIGWLFAKPLSDSLNGYQLTGGIFNHTAILHFDKTGDVLNVKQIYSGLNAYDQLSVEIELNGNLPAIDDEVKLQVKDFSYEFSFTTATSIRAISTRKLVLPDESEIVYTLDEEIHFDKCKYLDDSNTDENSELLKQRVSRVTLNYEPNDNALRLNMINKVGGNDEINPCTDGSAVCGYNSLCRSIEEVSYECVCKNGFIADGETDGIVNCVDIDECSGENICDQNADCYNEPGGYSCSCRSGYEGTGHTCTSPQATSSSYTNYPEHSTPTQRYETFTQPPAATYKSECESCSQYADCVDERCTCKNGWNGDGYQCDYNCQPGYYWNRDSCVPESREEEEEDQIQPYCTQQGCSCATGYILAEDPSICRRESYESEEEHIPPPCDYENNCSQDATCKWSDEEARNKCVCNPGFDGDGMTCQQQEQSCIFDDICDPNAMCLYDDKIGRSACKCNDKFEGDGLACKAAAECIEDNDCGVHSMCEFGVCNCMENFERDISDFCVPIGSCGGVYCASNAACKYDEQHQVPYCECIEGYIGDGIKSCKQPTPTCNVRNNCGLYASCAPNYREPSKYECVCDPGYFGDGFVCTPEENCLNVPALCHSLASCHSTTSGLKCICNQGFIGNGSYCAELPRYESGFLIVSQGVATIKVPFDGKKSGRPVAISMMAIGVDKDCAEGRFYWSDISSKSIMSANYDGTNKKPFITENIISPEGIAIDWISRRLYWTDSSKDTIEVASLDNPNLRAVIISTKLVNPRGIAVDPSNQKLYWSDWNRFEPKIEWSNLDGSERSLLLSAPSVELPNSLVVSQHTGELCFADAGTKKVECLDAYSKRLRTIASDLFYPFGLAVTTDRFYWTDWTTKKIESVDFNGYRKDGIQAPLFGQNKMYGMTAITDNCPVYFSSCHDNGQCPSDTICLANHRGQSNGRSCVCTKLDGC